MTPLLRVLDRLDPRVRLQRVPVGSAPSARLPGGCALLAAPDVDVPPGDVGAANPITNRNAPALSPQPGA